MSSTDGDKLDVEKCCCDLSKAKEDDNADNKDEESQSFNKNNNNGKVSMKNVLTGELALTTLVPALGSSSLLLSVLGVAAAVAPYLATKKLEGEHNDLRKLVLF